MEEENILSEEDVKVEAQKDLHNEEQDEVLVDENLELKPEVVANFVNKNDLLDKTLEIEPTGLGKNKWSKYFLVYDHDEESQRVNINKENFNTLLKLLGPRTSEWSGKRIIMKGVHWEGDILNKETNQREPKTGVELKFISVLENN